MYIMMMCTYVRTRTYIAYVFRFFFIYFFWIELIDQNYYENSNLAYIVRSYVYMSRTRTHVYTYYLITHLLALTARTATYVTYPGS